MTPKMPALAFRGLLDLLMVNDPTPIAADLDDSLQQWAHDEARARGYDGWFVAYHEFTPDEEA